MELSYPNYHLEDHEVDGNVTIPDDGLELTDHASIPTVRTPAKMPPWYHSDSFYDEGLASIPRLIQRGRNRWWMESKTAYVAAPSVITVLRNLLN